MGKYLELVKQVKLGGNATGITGHARPAQARPSFQAGAGPCPSCGCRLWFRNHVNTGPWQCRHCVSLGQPDGRNCCMCRKGGSP
jgi:hypothetical protein